MVKYIWRRIYPTEERDANSGFWRLFRDEKRIGDFDNEQKAAIDKMLYEVPFRKGEVQTDFHSFVDISNA